MLTRALVNLRGAFRDEEILAVADDVVADLSAQVADLGIDARQLTKTRQAPTDAAYDMSWAASQVRRRSLHGGNGAGARQRVIGLWQRRAGVACDE